MKQLLSYRKIFGAKLNLLALLLAISFTTYAQNRLINPNHNRYLDRSVNQNLTAKTAATATCPTSPVTLGCQDSTNIVNGTATTIANNSTLACNNQSIVIYSNGGSVSNENTPCVSTIYSPYYTNVRNQVTETFYEGGQNIGCVGPTGCSFPIGGTPNLSISGVTNWSVLIGYLDPTLQHDFTFCRAGNITATSVSLQDCWTGATLAGPVPLSNASAAPCFTMTLPANTDIGTANYSIAPASASASLINYGDGEAQIKTYMLPAGTYTVTYTFTPPVSSGCGPVTGTYKFTVGPNPTVSVTSPTVCAGITPTITASGTSTSYSWSPSTNLSASTGSVVTYNGSTSTTYTVTGMKGGCTSLPATSTITINPTPTVTVNSPSICPGATATLTASGATTYSWSAGLSATTGGSVTATPASATVYTVTGTSLTCTSSATATITISPTPTVSVNSPSICPGGTATLIASGATTYSWSAGLSATTGGSVTATPASATVYTVTGTASTCTSSATATVSIIPTVTITATSATVCPGGTGTLTASGASTYTWTPVTGLTPATGGTVQANPSSTTVYTITGADINNCLASPGTATLTISAIGSLVVSNDTSICPGGSAVLIASGATSYSWSPTTGLSPTTGSVVTATPSSATSYTVTGTTGSCTSQGVINIAISPTPTVLVNSATICIGDSAILKATGATTYSWTSATGLSATTGDSVKASPSSTTIYTVTGTAGCSATATATVTTISSPSITVTPSSNPICLGASSTLTATGASTYTWTADPTLSTTTNSVTVATPSLNNTSYTVSGSVGTCSAIPTVITISVTPNPTVTATSTVTCAGTATSLTASGATTYTWTPATGLSSATGSFVTTTPTTTSFYTVTGTDGNGCIGVNTATVTANPLPNVNAGLDVPVCKGGSVQLGATGADTYIWTPSTGLSANNVSNPTATPSVTTSYNVVGTNTLTGCTKTDNVQVTISSVNPVIIADPQTGEAPLTVGFTNGTTGATTYTWSYGNGSTQVTSTNVNTQTIYQNVGTYTVTLSAVDATGCPGQTSTVIIVTEGFSISIPNIFTPNGDAINDNFFVKSSGVSTMNIIIFDRWGLKMWESNSPTGMWDGKSGSADAKDGTYFYIIKVTDTKNVSTDYKGNITLIR